MEKLIYVLWKRDGVAPDALRREMLGELAPKLIEHGVRGLSLNLADDAASFASALRITQMEDFMAATVSVWLDTHLDRAPVEEALRRASKRVAGYLTLESVPIVNRKHVAPAGERTPGITTVAFLEKPAPLAYEAWREQWQGHHTRVAIETQSTFLYIQNVVVRALTEGAPPWTAIVEEAFPAEAATDPMVFYAAEGSPEKLAENQRRMIDSCLKFVDFATLESHPMSTYVLAG